MVWEGANVRQSVESVEDTNAVTAAGAGNKRYTKETVEAALSRLHTSYATAMECLGAWHRADQALRRGDSIAQTEQRPGSQAGMLRDVGQTTRQLFESALLRNPLVAQHAPAFHDYYSKDYVWEAPPTLTSAGHRETVRRVAYLSLVNYADLLLSGCACPIPRLPPRTGQKEHLLDKGITQPLATFREEKHCCWNRPRNDTETSPVGDSDSEDPVETTRRALTVLLDATALDPTDPLVWLKLSCLARRLGRLKIAVAMKDDTLLLPYRRLERHGLEMARIALPPNVPPNRLVLRALVELEEEETIFFTNGYDSGPLLQDVMEIRLSIPRYSWSILGRMLMRVCREGNLYTVTATAPHTNSHRHRGLSGPLRSAPLVRLELSPLLAVPSMVLAGICQFLTPAELARLEMTCRGLSYAVIAARAVHDHEQDLRASRQGNLDPAKLAPLGSGQPKPVVAETASDNRSTEVILEVDPNGDAATTDVNRKSRKKDHQTEEKRENQRVSKRVRSQMITSGKRAERSSRRSSLEYCVVAATMDCAPGDSKYDQLRREKIDWDHLLGLPPTPSALSAYWARSLADPTPLRTISLDVFPRDRQARERISSSSLTSFVNEWGGLDKPERRAVTPLGLLFGFVAHASLHVNDIFNSETGGPVVLSTCLIECFELMVRRTRTSFSLTPCWSTFNRNAPGRLNSMDIFAVDLLHVELRLKRCERDDSRDTELDGDASFLSRSIPVLVSLVDDLDEIYSGPSFAKLWVVLKVRCLWLAAAFYMWRGRIALCVFESREAEKEGFAFVAKLLDLMVKAQVGAVLTPHLESPTRSGLHWRELSVSSLRTYQNEIQASSVVLLAQEKFSQALCNIADEGDAVIDPISIDSLVAIGNLILDRYRVPVGSSEDKYSELITDFISSTGAILVSSQFSVHPGTVQQDSIGSECDDLLPARNPAARQLKNMTNPSILAILNTCLLLDKDKRLDATLLLMRLVASIRNSKKALVLELAQSRYDASKDGESLSEDSSLFSDISTDKNEEGEFGKQLLLRQYATTATLLLHRIRELFVLRLTEQQKVQFSNSEEFRDTLASSFDICRSYASTAIWFNELSEETPADLNVLLSTIALLTAVQNAGLVLVPEELERNYFIGLASILEQQRSTIASLMDCELSRQERVAHQKVASHRARVAGSVSFHIGQIFAAHLCTPSSRQLVASSFFDELSIPSLVIASTIDSLLWFRDLSVKDDHQSRAAASLRNFCFSLDRASRETLLVPTALAIVGTIGALASTKDGKLLPAKKECLRNTDLAEFFDSDDSAVDWLSDDSVVADKVGHEELLRSISQSVHAISLVFQSLSAETMLTYKDTKEYATEHGPLLPLLAARVLNMYADRLLTEFLEDPEKGTSTLSSDFPFGTRSVGVLLDSVLYKVYKCLHGFSFINMRDGKECSGPTIIDSKQRTFLPEDAKATAALYSCMMRSYGQGRKSPPKSALELLTRALPSAMESDLSRTVRRFVFSTANGRIGASDIVSIMNQDGERRADFKCFENWHWEKLHEMEDIKEEKDELLAVRRGVSHFLAQGPLPTYQDGAPNVRAASAKAEEALSRKFNAILDDLCHGSIADCKGWYKAAQCLLVRSDLIADRLGLSKGFVRSDHFNVPEWKGFVHDTLAIEELLKRQSEEASIHTKHWVEFLGPDLSIFLHYNWSSFESLRALATEMEASLSHFVETDDADTLKAREAWDEIEHLFRTKDFVAWQEAWGGLFVSSLRQLAARCMALGLYILNQSLGHGDLENKVVLSELTESLGMSLYAELMGSQLYGYPMQEMPQGQKRCIATAALACFSHSVHMSRSVNLDKPADVPRATWDILFMIGKCNEKIASTYRAERFSFSAIDFLNKQGTRLYEQHMNNAFESYSISLSEAREIEREGGLIFEQNGGSAHGSTEVLYRLHASRLKCLIAAVERREDERASAEEEALRLTEKYWFSAPQLDSRRSDARERIWAVLADTVSALAQCRSEHSFFHRSVYRHAQALMWAPVLNDPINERPNGSFGAVPGTKAVKVRGLNSATNAADSGAVVMSTLFDKKRSQLCAVWVANGSASSFQSINNSVRKYDCLRGKYISAYLECLKLSKRRSDLETFLRWTASCHRDLPSYFAASAFAQGSSPVKSHTQDSLIVRTRSLSSYHFLTSTKRLANTALANVILQEISGPSDRKDPETQLKAAYGCFLRLNSDPDAFIKCKWWKYHRSPSGMRPIADALMHAYKKIAKSQSPSTNQSDWGEGQTSETLRLSLRKCKELFPSATGSFLSSKASMNKSKRKVDREANGSGTKRKEPDGTFTALRSFVVPVPKGLSSADTFLTSIIIGSTTKKLRLTVPEGEPATLRFSLRVPVSDEPDCGAGASSHL